MNDIKKMKEEMENLKLDFNRLKNVKLHLELHTQDFQASMEHFATTYKNLLETIAKLEKKLTDTSEEE